jgi:hypothetical protein
MKGLSKILGAAFLFSLFLIAVLLGLHYRNTRSLMAAAYTKAKLGAFAMASASYYNYYTNWPQSLNDLFSKSNVFVAQNMQRVDGWERAMQYQPFDPKLGYGVITSLGRDGKLGGTNTDADIVIFFGPFGMSPTKPVQSAP